MHTCFNTVIHWWTLTTVEYFHEVVLNIITPSRAVFDDMMNIHK